MCCLCLFWGTASAGWRGTRLVKDWTEQDPKAIAKVQAICRKLLVYRRTIICRLAMHAMHIYQSPMQMCGLPKSKVVALCCLPGLPFTSARPT